MILALFISLSKILEVFWEVFQKIDSESAMLCIWCWKISPGHQVLDLQVPGATQPYLTRDAKIDGVAYVGGVKNPGGSGTEPGGGRIFLSSVGKINPKLYAFRRASPVLFLLHIFKPTGVASTSPCFSDDLKFHPAEGASGRLEWECQKPRNDHHSLQITWFLVAWCLFQYFVD